VSAERYSTLGILTQRPLIVSECQLPPRRLSISREHIDGSLQRKLITGIAIATLLTFALVVADLATGGRPDPPALRAAATLHHDDVGRLERLHRSPVGAAVVPGARGNHGLFGDRFERGRLCEPELLGEPVG